MLLQNTDEPDERDLAISYVDEDDDVDLESEDIQIDSLISMI